MHVSFLPAIKTGDMQTTQFFPVNAHLDPNPQSLLSVISWRGFCSEGAACS